MNYTILNYLDKYFLEANALAYPGNTKRGKYHCTVDLLFDWFGLVCFANKNKNLSAVIHLIPNQSNWRPMVQ